MANINKIKLSGTTYNIQDSNAALVSDVFITAQNRNSIQSVIKEGVYSLSTDDVYSITGTKANSTDRIKGLIIVDNTSYNFTGSTSSDVEGVSALVGIVTFDLSSNFSISLVDRDTNHINELFIESFTSDGEESPMTNITITHNPSVGVNKIDYVATLYTEFVHEKYALSEELSGKQDTLIAGTGIDITNDVISVTGKTDSSAFTAYTAATDTALASKQTTLTAGTNITIVDNVISATGGTGGGKAISAGTNISVTTGETADTIKCTLPITSRGNALSFFNNSTVIQSSQSVNFGYSNSFGTNPTRIFNFGDDNSTPMYGNYYYVNFGDHNSLEGYGWDYTFGTYLKVTNQNETAFGKYNKSNTNTLFSIGNGTGTTTSARHNAFEIRQNGDIYFNDGINDVKLQDKFSSIETTIGNINTILESI